MARATQKRPRTSARRARTFAVEVVWGSVIETTGDVHLVGHYQGVLPQNAEEVLDKAVYKGTTRTPW